MRDQSQRPCLHRISVVAPGFLLPEGAPIPKGTLLTQPIPRGDLASQSILEGIPRVAFPPQHIIGTSASSHPTNEEKDEGEEEKEKEIVDVLESDSEDLFKAFNQPPSLMTLTGDLGQFSQSPSSHVKSAITLTDEIGIQMKQRSTL